MAESLLHAQAAGAPAALIEELRTLYASGGRAAIVDCVLRVNANGPPLMLALYLGEAGRFDDAFRQRDAAIALRDPSLVHLAVAPQWDCLRGDPRFSERLRRMGLPARTWQSPPNSRHNTPGARS